jgi:hypothetical protein
VNSKRSHRTQAALSAAALAGGLLAARTASAEVTLVKSDSWEVYTGGRVNAFFGYAFGQGAPIATSSAMGPRTLTPGGVYTGSDNIPALDANGQPDPTKVGTISKMRFRSGFVPNVLTLGARRKINETTTVKAQISVWGTIESPNQRKAVPVVTDWREGYMEVDGTWGTFTAGRFGSLFSRGITEMDFLYLHGYGVGFWGGGGLSGTGPTAGLIGFGVLAAFFSPGIMYSTPSLSGVKLAVGLFDPVSLPGSYDTTRSARPETELTYDIASGSIKAHLFANGAYQKVYLNNKTQDGTAIGAGYGGRIEFGPFHIGGGGHYGKGLGLYYALEGGDADHAAIAWDPNQEFRLMDGYSAFAQYAQGTFDVNLGYGISRVHLLAADKVAETAQHNESVLKNQQGIAAAFVYHATENIHLDLDYLNASFNWYAGEKQTVNFVNTGVTMTW